MDVDDVEVIEFSDHEYISEFDHKQATTPVDRDLHRPIESRLPRSTKFQEILTAVTENVPVPSLLNNEIGNEELKEEDASENSSKIVEYKPENPGWRSTVREQRLKREEEASAPAKPESESGMEK
jgi:hypothetical protein